MGTGRNPKLIQLRRQELCPLARGWQDLIIHNIIPTGNKSEITVARAVLIHSIIQGDDVRAEDIIADNMVIIAQSKEGKGLLGFPRTIYKLCKDARVRMREFKHTEQVPEERYITAKVMEATRIPRIIQQNQHQEEEEDEEDQAMPQVEVEDEYVEEEEQEQPYMHDESRPRRRKQGLTLFGESLASTDDANPRINRHVTHEATLYQTIEWVDQHRSISPRLLIFQSNGPRSLEHG
ncbi:hypothetical protein PIB30_034033 [Stylosanthes scabra]|uniref:Putative plant transposon protein domain-containing protein n=1 Tax=Stylosanthes scabra TaxID=79078 RepID=A0ABU6XEG4_9FABA|nr:hypothetical protein [Stylosanthes scabra]